MSRHISVAAIWVLLCCATSQGGVTTQTDRILNAGFFPPPGEERRDIKGLARPTDVLEKIYYKNAVRL